MRLLYLRYASGLLLITAMAAAIAAFVAPRTAWAALAVSFAALQCLLFAFFTSARVVMGIAMARFVEAKIIEPVVLPILARAIDVNDKASSVAAALAAEFKARADGVTARIPVVGPLAAWLARRVPVYLLERKLTPRVRDAINASGALRLGAELPTREERAAGLLNILRDKLREQAEHGMQWLLWTYAGLCVVETMVMITVTRLLR